MGRTNTAKKYAGDDEPTKFMPRTVLQFPRRLAPEKDEAPPSEEPRSRQEPRRGVAPRPLATKATDDSERSAPAPSSARRPITPSDAERAFPEVSARPARATGGLAVPSVFNEPQPSKRAVAPLGVTPRSGIPIEALGAAASAPRSPRPDVATVRVHRKPERFTLVSVALSALALIFATGILVGRMLKSSPALVDSAIAAEPDRAAAPAPSPAVAEPLPPPASTTIAPSSAGMPVVAVESTPPAAAPSVTAEPVKVAAEPVKAVVEPAKRAKPRSYHRAAPSRAAAVAAAPKPVVKRAAPAAGDSSPPAPAVAGAQNEDDLHAATTADDLARAQLEATFQ